LPFDVVKSEGGCGQKKHMENISRFSFEKYEGAYEKRPLLSRLFVDGQDVQKEIYGFVIEAQYKCDDVYLVITSMDCPFEESSHFMLLDLNFNVVASANLIVPYCSFLIHRHWPISRNAIRIHYYDELFFSATIAPANLQFGKSNRLQLVRDNDISADPEALNAISDEKQQKRNWQRAQTQQLHD
jgi:hypothetical protein